MAVPYTTPPSGNAPGRLFGLSPRDATVWNGPGSTARLHTGLAFCLSLAFFLALFCPLLCAVGCAKQPESLPEPTARETAGMADPSSWKLSPEAEHLYYYLLLTEGLSDNSQLVIGLALQGLLKLDPSLPVFQDSATILLARGEFSAAESTTQEGLRHFPDDPLLVLLLAGAYSESAQVPKAIELLEKYLQKRRDDKQAIEELVRLYLRDGQDTKASDLLARLPKVDDSPESELFRAGVLSTVGRNTEAKNLLHRLLQTNPDLYEGWLELGYIAEGEKNHAEAIAAYKKAAALMPDNPDVWLRVATLQIKEKQPDDAMQSLELASPSGPLYIQAALSFADVGYYEQALLMLDKAEKNGTSPDEAALLRSMLLQEQHAETPLAALKPLEAIPENSPAYASALQQKTRIYMIAREYAKAHATALEGRKRFPDHKELWGLEAYALVKMKKGGDAEKLLKKALEQYPRDEDLLFSLGSVQDEAGKKEAAMKTMELLITINPKNHQALNYVGYTLADNDTELKRALTLITAALEQSPDADYIVDSLAWVLYRMGRYEEAWNNIKRCISLGGNDATIWEHYGDIARAMDNTEEAVNGYAESVARKPGNIDAVRKKLTDMKKRQTSQ